MGYCYFSSGQHNGKLVCDICGVKPAKKCPCPFGWCQPYAICQDCVQSHPELTTAEYHRELGCEKCGKEFQARMELEKRLLDEGKLLRCAALGKKSGTVHVLFRDKNQVNIGFYMSKKAYDAFPLATPVTPEDFAKHGELIPAPSRFN